ncbi:hypothetical protein BDN72DRAFT_895046 [Pluteus cervinus]|uniref:Uncharacterized protein n=1 Tax=Pluteus cervinus TaxID=181527 RepID=A0ACD3B2Z4_9AGAR|nr:hypothetical protein BDN72DRAFT_895046 [Pluteus cervinus]
MATAFHSALSPLKPTPSPRRHRQSGILLPSDNNNSPYISSASASSTSSAASSSSSHTSLTNTPPSSAPSSRRIRFAPLPDPRRSVVVTEDGRELPLSEDANNFPCSPAPLPQEDTESNGHETSSLSSSGSASKRNSFADSAPSTPGTMTPISTSPEDEIGSSLSTFSPAPVPKKSSLFQRFTKKSSSQSSTSSTHSLTPTLTPTSSHDPASALKGCNSSRKGYSPEEILTLGAINLFRASSRDQNDGTSGWTLQRWTSATGKDKEPEPSWGAPLTRSQSSQSAKAKRSFLSIPSPLSNSSNKPQPPRYTTVGGNRTGTRMLNGRIYGGKRRNQPNANPFANARDEVDPEFVEWGYGGMGSVKNSANSSNVWNRLQTDGRGVTVGHTTPAEEDDDGSGLAWVRRRREERERLKREQEQLEKETSEPAKDEQAEQVPFTEEPTQMEDAVSSPPTHNNPAQEHDTRAITIPAPHRHHHHRSNSRRSLDLHPAALEKELAAVAQRNEQKDTAALKEEEEEVSGDESPKDDDEDSSEDESDVSGLKEDDDDSEDESEEEDDDAGRKMVLGAGVEKISRHKSDAGSVSGLHARSEEMVEVNTGGGGGGNGR